MASSGGTSSGSSLQQNSSSEEEIQLQIMDERERKRKRMQSNRESARRSRMRKQKHLDELTAQITHLNFTRHQLISNINATTQHYLKVEAENSVLRAQMGELINRLESVNEISNVLIASTNSNGGNEQGDVADGLFPIIQEPFDCDSFLTNPWNTNNCFNQLIMASATMFQD